jgi:chemotaxis response regulator CheB
LLATLDPVFAALCKRALEARSNRHTLVAVAPANFLETLRRLAPHLLVLDADGQDVTAIRALAMKAMLLSEAPLVFVSAYLAPGSAGLSALLQSIPVAFVQKPRGPSSVSLADEDGPLFVDALHAAFAAQQGDDLADASLDAEWDAGDTRPRRKARAAHD